MFEGIPTKLIQEKIDRCIVRVTTSYWHDHKGIYMKKSIKTLRRKSKGDYYDALIEEAQNIGAEDVFPIITNLNDAKDGLYEVVMNVLGRDWETGDVDDYEFQLIPFEEPKDVRKV